MIECLMNILHSMPGVLSTLHSMPGVYLNELFTPWQEFTFYEHVLLHAGSFNDFTKYSNFYGRDQAFAHL
jgi:hypothetical protein